MHELPPFSITLAGTQNAVRDGLAQAMMLLAPLQLGTDESGTVELVLAEALNNVFGTRAFSRNKANENRDLQAPRHVRPAPYCDRLRCAHARWDRAYKKAPNLDVNTDDMPKEGLVGI